MATTQSRTSVGRNPWYVAAPVASMIDPNLDTDMSITVMVQDVYRLVHVCGMGYGICGMEYQLCGMGYWYMYTDCSTHLGSLSRCMIAVSVLRAAALTDCCWRKGGRTADESAYHTEYLHHQLMPCALVTLPVHPRTHHTPVDQLLQVELPSRLREGWREGEEEREES